MGATPSANSRNPIALKTENKEIILHYTYKTMLKISQATTFPHGYEGLKTWDANVVMARFVLINLNKFKDKNVIEMCSGTGLVGVTLGKYTSSKKIALTDLTDEVVGVIRNNCSKNEISEDRYIAFRLMWDQYVNFVSKYDIILASDPFFHRCSPQLLAAVANHYLEPGGILYISSPKSAQLERFIKIAEETKFEVRKQKLNSYEYLSSPLLNQVDGQKQFPSVCAGEIDIYEVVKRPPIRGYHEDQVNTIHREQLERAREHNNYGYNTPKKEKQLQQIAEKVEEEQGVADGKKEPNEETRQKKEEPKEQTLEVVSDNKQQEQIQNNDDQNVNEASPVETQKHNQISQTKNTEHATENNTLNLAKSEQAQQQTKVPASTQNNETLQKNNQDIAKQAISSSERKLSNSNQESRSKEEEVVVLAESGSDSNKIVGQVADQQIKQVHKQEPQAQASTQIHTISTTPVSQVSVQNELKADNENEQKETKEEQTETEQVKQQGEQKESEAKKKKKKNKKK